MGERIIHIAENFYDFIAELSGNEIKQIQKAVKQIKKDPMVSALRRHKLSRVPSKGVVSYSPNRDLRIIAWEPDSLNTYLLYVNHHDTAYLWARLNQFSQSGGPRTLEIVKIAKEAENLVEYETDRPEDNRESGMEQLLPERQNNRQYLFDPFDDTELLAEGISKSWIPLVRRIMDDHDLMLMIDKVPSTIGEQLFGLFELMEKGIDPEEPIMTKPKESESPMGQTFIFHKIESDPEMEQWLASMEAAYKLSHRHWRTFLHPVQRKAVTAQSMGPIRVTGGAGTGKTVVGIHRAKHLVDLGAQRVYLITYNRTLMRNLVDIVRDEFGAELGNKYIINTFHALIPDLLEKNSLPVPAQCDFNQFLTPGISAISPEPFGERWTQEELLLIKNEIIRIIAPLQIKEIGQYIRTPRKDVSRVLTVPQKEAVWGVFDICWKVAWEDNRLPLELLPLHALRHGLTLKEGEYLIMDEVQDLDALDLTLIGSMAKGPNQLTLLEDTKQRIYGPGYSLKSLGIHVVGRRSINLFINYRTTAQIGETAHRSLCDQGLSVTDFPRPLRQGEMTIVKTFGASSDEFKWVTDEIKKCQNEGLRRIAVLARTKATLEAIEPTFEAQGIDFSKLDRYTALDSEDLVALCTMHSSKGLEFDAVFVIGINYGKNGMRVPKNLSGDKIAVTDFQRRERHLLYVALSRARERLFVSGSGDLLKLFGEK